MTERVNNLFHPDTKINATALKHWLKVNGFVHTANKKDDFLRLLEKLVNTGELTRERLNTAIREIEETGGKRIFLRYLVDKTAVRSRRALEGHLKSAGLPLDETPTITHYRPKKPVINYISWEQEEEDDRKKKRKTKKKKRDKIRIKFSETHLRRDVDLEKGRIATEEITKFVVASVEVETGFTCIFFDYPEEVHPHKDGDEKSRRDLYEKYYFDWIIRIFDSNGLEKFDVEKACDRLVNRTPRIFRVPYETVRTGGNSRQRYVSGVDVRDDPARQGADRADGDNWVFEDVAGYWLPGMSKGRLQRELFTQLIRTNSMIRVLADCLAGEVDYVISRLR